MMKVSFLWTPRTVSLVLLISWLHVFETDKLTAPFNTRQRPAWYSANTFPGFVFSSRRAQFLNLYLFLGFFPPWSWGENFPLWWGWLLLLASLFVTSCSRGSAGLIGNNPSAVMTMVQRSFSGKSEEYLFAVLSLVCVSIRPCYSFWLSELV